MQNRIKKIIIVLMTSIFIYGCGTKTIVKTIYVPVYPTTTTQPKNIEPETIEDFIQLAATKYPFVMTELKGRFGVIEFGNQICQAIDQGHTLQEFRNRSKSQGVDPAFLDYMTVIAVPVFCPQNKWFIKQIKI